MSYDLKDYGYGYNSAQFHPQEPTAGGYNGVQLPPNNSQFGSYNSSQLPPVSSQMSSYNIQHTSGSYNGQQPLAPISQNSGYHGHHTSSYNGVLNAPLNTSPYGCLSVPQNSSQPGGLNSLVPPLPPPPRPDQYHSGYNGQHPPYSGQNLPYSSHNSQPIPYTGQYGGHSSQPPPHSGHTSQPPPHSGQLSGYSGPLPPYGGQNSLQSAPVVYGQQLISQGLVPSEHQQQFGDHGGYLPPPVVGSSYFPPKLASDSGYIPPPMAGSSYLPPPEGGFSDKKPGGYDDCYLERITSTTSTADKRSENNATEGAVIKKKSTDEWWMSEETKSLFKQKVDLRRRRQNKLKYTKVFNPEKQRNKDDPSSLSDTAAIAARLQEEGRELDKRIKRSVRRDKRNAFGHESERKASGEGVPSTSKETTTAGMHPTGSSTSGSSSQANKNAQDRNNKPQISSNSKEKTAVSSRNRSNSKSTRDRFDKSHDHERKDSKSIEEEKRRNLRKQEDEKRRNERERILEEKIKREQDRIEEEELQRKVEKKENELQLKMIAIKERELQERELELNKMEYNAKKHEEDLLLKKDIDLLEQRKKDLENIRDQALKEHEQILQETTSLQNAVHSSWLSNNSRRSHTRSSFDGYPRSPRRSVSRSFDVRDRSRSRYDHGDQGLREREEWQAASRHQVRVSRFSPERGRRSHSRSPTYEVGRGSQRIRSSANDYYRESHGSRSPANDYHRGSYRSRSPGNEYYRGSHRGQSPANIYNRESHRSRSPANEYYTGTHKSRSRRNNSRDREQELMRDPHERSRDFEDSHERPRDIRDIHELTMDIRDSHFRERDVRASNERQRDIRDSHERQRDVRDSYERSRHFGDSLERPRDVRDSHERSRYFEESRERSRRSQSRSSDDQYVRHYEERRENSREGYRDDGTFEALAEPGNSYRDNSFRTLDNSKTNESQEERGSAFERLGGKVSIKSRLGGSFARIGEDKSSLDEVEDGEGRYCFNSVCPTPDPRWSRDQQLMIGPIPCELNYPEIMAAFLTQGKILHLFVKNSEPVKFGYVVYTHQEDARCLLQKGYVSMGSVKIMVKEMDGKPSEFKDTEKKQESRLSLSLSPRGEKK